MSVFRQPDQPPTPLHDGLHTIRVVVWAADARAAAKWLLRLRQFTIFRSASDFL